MLHHFVAFRRKVPDVQSVVVSCTIKKFLSCFKAKVTRKVQKSLNCLSEIRWFNRQALTFMCQHLMHDYTWCLACICSKYTMNVYYHLYICKPTPPACADRHITTLHLSFCSTAQTVPLITYITGLLTYNQLSSCVSVPFTRGHDENVLST